MRTIVVWLGDTHGGHRLGLCDPDVTLYEESEYGELIPWTPKLTATQEYLWDCYTEDIARVRDLADGDPIIVHHVGDLTQGKKYLKQLVSTRLADQLLIARANLLKWCELDNVVRVALIIGTASHVFGEGTSPVLLREMLPPEMPVDIVYHTRPSIDGVVFDAAHHGPSSGIREWTQGNQLRYYLKSLVIHDVFRGRQPPDLVVRAHFHKLWPETVRVRINDVLLGFLREMERALVTGQDIIEVNAEHLGEVIVHDANIVLLPSYCGMGEYGRMATGSSPTLSNGLVAAEVIDGELYKIHHFERELDIRKTHAIDPFCDGREVCASETLTQDLHQPHTPYPPEGEVEE